MKILFIVLPYLPEETKSGVKAKKRSFRNIPYGVMAISKYLNTKLPGVCDIKILDLNTYSELTTVERVVAEIKSVDYDLIGLSLMFDTSYTYIKDIAKSIKSYNNDIITIVGGTSATMSYKEIITDQTEIDAICYSEGEEPILRLVQSENVKQFLREDISFLTKESFQLGKTPVPSKLPELDDVVDLDYSMIDLGQYVMEEAFSPYCSTRTNVNQFFLITSRGCPFKCSFCMFSAYDDQSMRYASVDKLINHVSYLVEKYNMNTLTIYDDQLLLNKKRVKELFRRLIPFNLRIECPNGVTAMYIDDELAMLMRQAGMDSIQLAIESGSEHVSRNIINKPINLSRVKEIIQHLRRYDFWIQAYFVNGMPGELDEHRQETVDFINDTGFDWSSFSLAFPTMGSKLYDECIDKGYIDKDTSILSIKDNTNDYIINNPDYSKEHIMDTTYLMNLEVNFVNNYRMSQGDYEIAEKAFRDVLKRYSSQAFAQYYLGKALEAQGKYIEAENCFDDMHKIVNENSVWKRYFEHFNIDYTSVNMKPVSQAS